MLVIQNIKKIITKYFCRLLLFFIFYHGLVRPLQTNIIDKIVKPLVQQKIVDESRFKLVVNKTHVSINRISGKRGLYCSIPFGQAYFFLLFFLKLKPKSLVLGISIYNLVLIPVYSLFIILFLKGYFIFGHLVALNEKFYRLMYSSFLLLRIISRKQFNLIFDNPKKQIFSYNHFKNTFTIRRYLHTHDTYLIKHEIGHSLISNRGKMAH